MKVHYISPSILPSRSANSVHVAWQCHGLVRAGATVTLYAKRSIEDAGALPAALENAYGINAGGLSLATFFSRHARGDTLRIAGVAARHLRLASRGDLIVSRNLYAAYLLGVVQRRPLIFETHQLEQGIRKTLQRALVTRPWIATVLISSRLEERLSRHLGVKPSRAAILHDAAPDDMVPTDARRRREMRSQIAPEADGQWDLVCGYFGHLYRGRGIEMLEAMAARRRQTLFLVYGGNDADVHARRAGTVLPNLRFMGHVAHPHARRLMTVMDVLLMPYQQSVSIGVEGHDTAGWMSPMKMFEYLATGVPIIASDLPSLREVLRNGVNCLLVSSDHLEEWLTAVERLATGGELARQLGQQAHADYRQKHTWTRRAEALLDLGRSV
jgi:glycosyltransferase involved in cell wall biosynthesis